MASSTATRQQPRKGKGTPHGGRYDFKPAADMPPPMPLRPGQTRSSRRDEARSLISGHLAAAAQMLSFPDGSTHEQRLECWADCDALSSAIRIYRDEAAAILLEQEIGGPDIAAEGSVLPISAERGLAWGQGIDDDTNQRLQREFKDRVLAGDDPHTTAKEFWQASAWSVSGLRANGVSGGRIAAEDFADVVVNAYKPSLVHDDTDMLLRRGDWDAAAKAAFGGEFAARESALIRYQETADHYARANRMRNTLADQIIARSGYDPAEGHSQPVLDGNGNEVARVSPDVRYRTWNADRVLDALIDGGAGGQEAVADRILGARPNGRWRGPKAKRGPVRRAREVALQPANDERGDSDGSANGDS